MFIFSDVGRHFGILSTIPTGNSGEKTLGGGEQDEVNPPKNDMLVLRGHWVLHLLTP